MRRDLREVVGEGTNGLPQNETWSFARAALNEPVLRTLGSGAKADADCQRLHRLAAFSPRHAEELRKLQATQAQSRHRRALLEWTAQISSHQVNLRAMQTREARERADWLRGTRQPERLSGVQPERRQAQPPAHSLSNSTELIEWDPNQPRQPKGTSRGGQWAGNGGGDFLGNVIRRNQMVADLTGGASPGLIRSSRLAMDLQAATRLPKEVTVAAAAGLKTGGKAVVNGSATAIKNVATLGLSSSQLELIGVTEEDRAGGYDAAVTIATASGQVLIAVGTSGLTTALSKGGTIARTASGTLLAFDAAGNAVGVVQGAYDASQNGINLENGVQIAGSALGLGANAKSARELSRAASAAKLAEVEEYIATCKRKSTPKKSAANQYEIAHTGPDNYKVSGGGVSAEIDGYRGTTILETKFVGKPKYSPYIRISRFPNRFRSKVINRIRNQLGRMRTIIRSGETPFKSVEIITNTPESKLFFERMLKLFEIPGTVRLVI